MSHLTPNITAALLTWYDRHARELPWRVPGSSRPDPYAVLVSEVMLQQTTVAAVAPFFARWMKSYPTVQALAEAPEEKVLRSWEGLGYYSRARNLQAAARRIVREFRGRVPSEPDRLRTLPGVGGYTAGAVASMGFGKRIAAVDANVLRVLCRLSAFGGGVRSAAGRRRVERLASRLVPPERPGDFNQAVMDLGSLICAPRDPRCRACPAAPWCKAFRSGQVHLFPAKSQRLTATRIEAAIGIVRRRGRILVCRRPAGGLFAGMWEFPGGKVRGDAGAQGRRGKEAKKRRQERHSVPEKAEEAVVREVKEETGLSVVIDEKLGVFRHSYTRHRVTLHVFLCSVKRGRLKRKGARWVLVGELEHLPMPSANRRIVRALEAEKRPASRSESQSLIQLKKKPT